MTDDLLAALMDAAAQPDEDAHWLTAREIRARLGLSQNALYARLGQLVNDGQLECKFATRRRLDGRLMQIPVYGVRRDSEAPGG